MLEACMFGGGLSKPHPVGQVMWLTPGTYTWVAPEGVTSVCVVMVAPGTQPALTGSGGSDRRVAGAGGGLRYINNVSVAPGQSYTVVVGSGGSDSAVIKNGSFTAVTNGISSALGYYVGNQIVGSPLSDTVKGGIGGSATGQGNQTKHGAPGNYFNGSTSPPIPNPIESIQLGTAKGISLMGPSVAATTKDCGCGGYAYYHGSGNTSQRWRAGHGGVRIIWGDDRAYPNTRVSNLTPVP